VNVSSCPIKDLAIWPVMENGDMNSSLLRWLSTNKVRGAPFCYREADKISISDLLDILSVSTSGQSDGSSRTHNCYPLPISAGSQKEAEIKFGKNRILADITVSNFNLPYFEFSLFDGHKKLQRLLSMLERSFGRAPPAVSAVELPAVSKAELLKLVSWNLVISTDLNLTQGNVAACNIDTKTVYLHPYFFELPESKQLEILCHELISHIVKGIGDEDAAMEDTRTFISRTGNKIPETFSREEVLLDRFFTFKGLMEEAMYNCAWGFYSSGRVKFGGRDCDFDTWPIGLSPAFGSMIAENIFSMWEGMLKAGSIREDEVFTIFEFGAGEATLAFDILTYAGEMAARDERRSIFFRQLRYAIGERAPALRRIQLEKTSGFCGKVSVYDVDARAISASRDLIPDGIKGVVLSNELVDEMEVYKVRFSPDGKAGAAVIAPWVKNSVLRRVLPGPQADKIIASQRALLDGSGIQPREWKAYLSKEDFISIKNMLAGKNDARLERYFDNNVHYKEIFVPVAQIPELQDFLDENEGQIRQAVEDLEGPLTAYVNTGGPGYIEGTAGLLQAGYVITIDYGGSTLFNLDGSGEHIQRMAAGTIYKDNPFSSLGRSDITSDVDFSALAARGLKKGLKVVFYGDQRLLEKGACRGESSFLYRPEVRRACEENFRARYGISDKDEVDVAEQVKQRIEFFQGGFYTGQNFNFLIQQKNGTDPVYVYPARSDERELGVESADTLDGNLQTYKENCLIGYLRERKGEDLVNSLISGLSESDKKTFPGIGAPAYRINRVKEILKAEADRIFLDEDPLEQEIEGQVNRIYHVSGKGSIALSGIDDDCAWVAGVEDDDGIIKRFLNRFIHIFLPLVCLSGGAYALINVVSSAWGMPILSAAVSILASLIIASFFCLTENVRRIFEYDPARFFFGIGGLFKEFTAKERSALIRLADDDYSERAEEVRPSLGSTAETLFSLKNAILAAAGGAAVFIALGKLDWLILTGALAAIFIPYLISILYEFLCSEIDRYISRCEFVRGYFEQGKSHRNLEQDIKGLKTPPAFLRPWGNFALKFPVIAGVISFALVKLPVFVLGYLAGAAVVPLLNIDTASLSLSDLLQSLSGVLNWEWVNNFLQRLISILNDSGLLINLGEAVKLGFAVLGLGILSLFRRTEPFFKISFRNIVNFLPNLMHIWIAAVIIGGVSFGSLITDGARQVTGFNFPQAIHNYLGKENVDVWNKAYLLYQQIKTDPEAALQVEVDRKELEFLLEEFKDKEGIVNPDAAEVRRICIFMLGQDDSRVVHETLYAALSDADNDTKLIAAISLSMRNNREAVSLLGKVAFENEGPVQQAAILSLSNAGSSEATEFILKNLGDELHPEIRLAAAETLSYRVSLPEVTEALLGSLKSDPSPEVRGQAAYNLAAIDSLRIKDALVLALEDSDPLVKQSVILSVTPQADKNTMRLIKSFLSDQNPDIRQAATLSVGSRLDDFPSNLNLLKSKLSDEDLGVRSAAVSVLGSNIEKFSQLKMPFLDIVKDTSQPVEIRQDALFSLSKIDEPEIKSLLVDSLDSRDWQMRQSAALGLGNFEGDEIPGLLEPLTRDSSWQVRENTAVSLGQFNEPTAIQSITPLLKDNNVFVRQAAALSLGGKLQAYPQLVDPFIETMKVETDPFTRHIFASALRSIPSNSHVIPENNFIQESLIPGLNIGGWNKTHLETGIEIGYKRIIGPIQHTFIKVTYNGDTRTLGFNTLIKPGFLTLILPRTTGMYSKEFISPEDEKNPSAIFYYTLTTDPVETKKLYDIIPNFENKTEPYNVRDNLFFGKNCFGGRNFLIESAGITDKVYDNPWNPLEPNHISRSISMAYSDFYYSYSLQMQQTVIYFEPGVKNIETHAVISYNTIQQGPIVPDYNSSTNFQSSDFNSWNGNSFKSFPDTYSLPSSNYPSYNYVTPPSINNYVAPPPINSYVVPPSINNYIVPSIPYNPPTFNIPQSSTPGFSNWP
jgi:HEAT repeat protein/SAM-dependent MidA family methyltransferase